ncbi:methyltransferase [Thiocapsa imhoffii]|uniref:Methyltransferase n=1 Tax=Thiocapsa imhoffii TaxID=382777 RepID=A0A9X0WLL7_9GAMM|nr:MerR family transcriptional regulator [Thiocapsa imhoffii]MBK1646781.1 methyltransferase [Thiocapsa imhoffii]
MFKISELAKQVGLSRTALLYYEKLGLLQGQRQQNGYRVYCDADRQRLLLLQRLQAGGLSLKECQACLDGKIDRDGLARRLRTLEAEIETKNRSRALLTALLGRDSLKAWHEEVERLAPDLHRDWLMTQGFTSEDATCVALLSKDMNDHDNYMKAFLEIFSGLDYWGPGSPRTTVQALAVLPFQPERILDIGCGNGVATLVLAAHTSARITAIDTGEDALARLHRRAASAGFADRIDACCADMAHLPLPDQTYDVIWAEGSAYIIGVERALEAWRSMLRQGGVLVFSDMVWRTEQPSVDVREFWTSEYPAMTTVAQRLRQATRGGYRVLAHFDMGQAALDTYYLPLEERLRDLQARMKGTRVLDDLRRELRAYHEGDGQFGYEMFVLERR